MAIPISGSGEAGDIKNNTVSVREHRGRTTGGSMLPLVVAILFIATISPAGYTLPRDHAFQSALVKPFYSVLIRLSKPYPPGFCDGESKFFSSKLALAVFIPGIVFAFAGLAIVSHEYFVPSLELIADVTGISNDARTSMMAAASGVPELVISILGIFMTKDNIGISTVLGSTVFKILVIIILVPTLVGSVFDVDLRRIMRDIFFFLIGLVFLLVYKLQNGIGSVAWWKGLVLVVTYIAYLLSINFGRTYLNETENHARSPPSSRDDSVSESSDIPVPASSNTTVRFRAAAFAVISANRLRLENMNASNVFQDEASTISRSEPESRTFLGVYLPESILEWLVFPISFPWSFVFRWTIPDCKKEKIANFWPFTLVLALAWVTAITFGALNAARLIGCLLGVPVDIIGLTILTAGTNVPEAIATVAAARQGQANKAVSKSTSRIVFSTLIGLGVPWLLGGIILGHPIHIQVHPVCTIAAVVFVLITLCMLIALAVIFLRLGPSAIEQSNEEPPV